MSNHSLSAITKSLHLHYNLLYWRLILKTLGQIFVYHTSYTQWYQTDIVTH